MEILLFGLTMIGELGIWRLSHIFIKSFGSTKTPREQKSTFPNSTGPEFNESASLLRIEICCYRW